MAILISGLGLVQTEFIETDQDVVVAYKKQFLIIQNVLATDPNALTQADANSLASAISSLKSLAVSGLSVTRSDIHGNLVTTTRRLTADMARQVDLLVRSMDAAGVGSSPDVVAIRRWQDLGVQGINLVVNRAGQAINNNRSIQAMIELEYVKTGNDVLAEQLTSLRTALSTTQMVAKTLTQLQNIRNLLAPETKSAFTLSGLPTGDLSAAIEEYNQLASAAFGKPLDVVVNYKGQNPQNILNQMTQIRQALSKELLILDQLTPPTISSTGQAVRDPNSLGGKIATVLEDMQKFFDPSGSGSQVITQSGLEAWLIDNLNSHLGTDPASAANAAGKIQTDIDAAIQAATNLNDQQKEQFQRYMFVFQEFYKSAASMLSTINQIIATMAQNAGH